MEPRRLLCAFTVSIALLAACSGSGKSSSSADAKIPIPPDGRQPFCAGQSELATALAASPSELRLFDLAAASFKQAAESITATTPADVIAKDEILAVYSSIRLLEVRATTSNSSGLNDARQKTQQLIDKLAASC